MSRIVSEKSEVIQMTLTVAAEQLLAAQTALSKGEDLDLVNATQALLGAAFAVANMAEDATGIVLGDGNSFKSQDLDG